MKPKKRVQTALMQPMPMKKPAAKRKKPQGAKTALTGYGADGCTGNG
jgi:hypothetical protein